MKYKYITKITKRNLIPLNKILLAAKPTIQKKTSKTDSDCFHVPIFRQNLVQKKGLSL